MSDGRVADSVELAVFLQELHDALTHLRDLPLRRGHPLERRLRHSPVASPSALQQILLDGVERLRPPAGVAPDAPRSRRYRYLKLRYVEGARLDQVVADLGIGERQARREHRAALLELASLLLDRDVRALHRDAKDNGSSDAASGGESRAAAQDGEWHDAADVENPEVSSELEAELTALEASPDLKVIDLAAALEDATGLITQLAVSRGIEIDRPPALATSRVIADPTVLRQIFLNALSYLISDAATRCLEVSMSDRGSLAEIQFRARFQTMVGSEPRPGVHALALATAERLATGQEAVMRVEFQPGESRSVRIQFPTTDATLVLIVDDNPGLIRLFRRYLHATDFRLIPAHNALRAGQLARALHPNLILLDLMMPVHDGWDLFRSLRAEPITRAIPIIACSVLPERELALSLGADAFLAKPVTPESLLAALLRYRRLPASSADGGTYQDRP